ncbi:ATP-binding protein [Streptomyces sp. NPDC019890]|uniref:ATP-binding protein n=1 Tax=Streptomyces sp. NPDC019890 TaxID=3365064 RepID=UPI00384BB497
MRCMHMQLNLRLTATGTALRIEVADTRTERLPAPGELTAPPTDAESGRGLYLVARLADQWGVAPRAGAPGKQVWAELRLPQ